MADSALPILYTTDLPRLVGFYETLFGFEETYRWTDERGEVQFVVIRRDDFTMGVSRRGAAARAMDVELDDPSTSPSFELCLYVADVDATCDVLKDWGVTQIRGPVDRPWGERSAYVEDPDGNPVQIVTPLE